MLSLFLVLLHGCLLVQTFGFDHGYFGSLAQVDRLVLLCWHVIIDVDEQLLLLLVQNYLLLLMLQLLIDLSDVIENDIRV